MTMEKLGNKIRVLATVAAQKTSDATQITKHNITISNMEKEMNDIYYKIGHHIYNKFVMGVEFDETIKYQCEAVSSILYRIESEEMQKDVIKKRNLNKSSNKQSISLDIYKDDLQ